MRDCDSLDTAVGASLILDAMLAVGRAALVAPPFIADDATR